MVSDIGCRMTPERAEAILRAWETGLYVEWLDTDKAGYSLTPKRLIVGHCDERNRIIGRGYNVRSVTMGGDGLPLFNLYLFRMGRMTGVPFRWACSMSFLT